MNWKLLQDETARSLVEEIRDDRQWLLADLVSLRNRVRQLEPVDGIAPAGVPAELATIAAIIRDGLEHDIDECRLALAQLSNAIDLADAAKASEERRRGALVS